MRPFTAHDYMALPGLIPGSDRAELDRWICRALGVSDVHDAHVRSIEVVGDFAQLERNRVNSRGAYYAVPDPEHPGRKVVATDVAVVSSIDAPRWLIEWCARPPLGATG